MRQSVSPYIVVDTLQGVNQVRLDLELLLRNNQGTSILVGIDTEWGDDNQGVAVVQIGTESNVWLLDCMCTRKTTSDSKEDEHSQAMCLLLSWLFENESIIKLGYSFDHDFEQLNKIIVDLKKNSKNVCDIQTTGQDGAFIGLSTVVEQHLGLPMDKTEQCSEWNQRPLRKAQEIYAALDAVVLVDLACALYYNENMER